MGNCVGNCSVRNCGVGNCGGENPGHDIEGQTFEGVRVTVKVQETSQVVFEIHRTLSSACFGVWLVYQSANWSCLLWKWANSLWIYICLFACCKPRSSGVAAPAVAALDFVFFSCFTNFVLIL